MQKVGIDLAEVGRFKPFIKKPNDSFIARVFTAYERDYCFKRAQPAVHLAGIYAAKEAGSKALGVEKYPFIELEVRHVKSGAPELWHKNKRLKAAVSITHTKTMAAAVVVI